RMDRYFVGDIEDPKISSQPVGCQHCEMAPCEQVCPVAATTHSEEGLNDMIYNRCVGTRYCSNNCPYKVRRFNFHLYSESAQEEGNEVLKMVNNPEVTVRSRGVMEKCTFCVQRIHQGKAEARREERELKDGDITPACAQACPTNAITFGDLNDNASEVAKSHANPRSYELLGELNLDTRNRFLARIRNPHPSLASLEAPAGAPAGAHGEEVHHG
ncbi:MAG: 4Fe-4S dicluster domain-containing protein, partial [Planctomycetes bacterium]|nr:4Fe-4S dicluster domain-containing protein [Planctomycetota bacterium]